MTITRPTKIAHGGSRHTITEISSYAYPHGEHGETEVHLLVRTGRRGTDGVRHQTIVLDYYEAQELLEQLTEAMKDASDIRREQDAKLSARGIKGSIGFAEESI